VADAVIDAPPPTVPIEQEIPLSRSCLWRAQRAYFERAGLDAWRRGTVPHHVTSNPFIGNAYAEVIAGFVEDWCDDPSIPSTEPVHVIELGAGSGRLAFQILTSWAVRARPPVATRLRYVMTDLAERTVDEWLRHPLLGRFIADGVLDVARFDVERDRSIELRVAGTTLAPGGLRRPLAVIANYVFDGLPQDVFRDDAGTLQLGFATLTAPSAIAADEAALLQSASVEYEYRGGGAASYADSELDAVVAATQTRRGGVFGVPIGALRCCQRLRELAGGRLFLLAADKGWLVAPRGSEDPPTIAVHGSISLDVDFGGLADLFTAWGGRVVAADREPTLLVVAGFGAGDAIGARTERALRDAIVRFGPDEYFAIRRGVVRDAERFTLQEIFAHLRLGLGDARLFHHFAPLLAPLLTDATPQERDELVQIVDLIWQRYFPIGEDHDLALELGVALADAGRYREAAVFFERSFSADGPDPHVAFNLALCHHRLGDSDAARRWVDEAVALDPEHRPALQLRTDLVSSSGRRARVDPGP
jgi:hypothetical protein